MTIPKTGTILFSVTLAVRKAHNQTSIRKTGYLLPERHNLAVGAGFLFGDTMKTLTIPKTVVRNRADAVKAEKSLRGHVRQLTRLIDDDTQKRYAPIVRRLNARIEKGETLYVEILGGKRRFLVYKACSQRFRQNWNGHIVHADSATIDRVFRLNLGGKSELIYERDT